MYIDSIYEFDQGRFSVRINWKSYSAGYIL